MARTRTRTKPQYRSRVAAAHVNQLLSRTIECTRCGWSYGPNLELSNGDRRLARHRQTCDAIGLESLTESDINTAKERGYLQ